MNKDNNFKNNLNSSLFNERYSLGDFGEEVVREFFEKNGYNYKDVTKDSNFQIIDVDFLVDINDKEYKMETKTLKDRMAKYDSIMVKYHTEYLNPVMRKKKGNDAWYAKSRADFIIFVCAKTKKILIVNFAKLKEYIEKYMNLKNEFGCDYITKGRYLDKDEQHNGRYTRKNTVLYISITHLCQELNKNGREFAKIFN